MSSNRGFSLFRTVHVSWGTGYLAISGVGSNELVIHRKLRQAWLVLGRKEIFNLEMFPRRATPVETIFHHK